jgi:hypothetical protein
MITLNEEKGFVLMTALLIMIILTLVGLGAILNSSVEINIASNERLKKDALFAADAGSETVPAIISYYIQNCPANISALSSDFQAIMKDDAFLSEINGYGDSDGATDTTTNNPDVQMTVQGRQVNIDIDRLYKKYIPGNEFEAPGEQPTPAIVVYYRADALGQTGQGTNNTVEANCRQFPNNQ